MVRTNPPEEVARTAWNERAERATRFARPVLSASEAEESKRTPLLDSAWLPLLVTPPFPEYPSGHSVQSGAAFQVLTDLFGERYPFVDRTHDARGLAPRRFGSFQAAISRLYGGIHFRAAIENGLRQGRRIGRAVSLLPLRD